MNNHLKKIVAGVVAIFSITTNTYAEERDMMNQTASYIEMKAANGQTEKFAQFLISGAKLVKETEPDTKLWFALEGKDNTLAIFDIFKDEAARDAHFAGKVAVALKEQSSTLVRGGWDKGVIPAVKNSKVLSEKAPVDLYNATTATYIKIKAAQGQADNLAELLAAAGSIVTETEPQTLYWVALRLDENHFAIFDIFANEEGRKAHFAGKVAGLLKAQSNILVDGGWDKGVVTNVHNYNILAIK